MVKLFYFEIKAFFRGDVSVELDIDPVGEIELRQGLAPPLGEEVHGAPDVRDVKTPVHRDASPVNGDVLRDVAIWEIHCHHHLGQILDVVVVGINHFLKT